MKVTNAEIWGSQGAIRQMLSQKLPVRASHDFARMAKKLNEQWQVINEERNRLVTIHGEKDKKTGQTQVKVNTPEMEAFNKDFQELLAIEVDIDVKPVKLPEVIAATCDKCHHNMDRPFEIEPAILFALDKFVEV